MRAMNLGDLRGNGADQVDNGNLGDGADDGGFDLNDYKGTDSTSSTTGFPAPTAHQGSPHCVPL